MALSKSSLSGYLDFTPARGLALKSTFFFFLGCFSLAWTETAPRTRKARATAAIFLVNWFIPPHCGSALNQRPSAIFQTPESYTSTRLRPCEPPPAGHAHPAPHGQRRIRQSR